MIGTYYQGQDAIIFANFLVMFGSEPTTITNQKITIKHIENGSETIDVNAASLTQITGNEYYYKWSIPVDAFVGDYLVAFSATVDGEYAESIDNIKVLSASEATISGLTSHYTTEALVLKILGDEYTLSDIDEDFLSFIDGYIDALICTTYRTSISKTELLDIERSNIDTIFLEKSPIVSVDYVKDDGNTLDTDVYVIYNEQGVIALKDDPYWRNFNEVGYFTKGRQTVEVKYSYGATSIPTEITYLASLLVADVVEGIGKGSYTGTRKKEKMGDYSYENAISKDSPRALEIKELKNTVINRYGTCCDNKAI